MKLNEKGFTLIELLMTIIIISVVAFITVSAINFNIKDARRKNKENEDEVLKSAVAIHVTNHQMDNKNNIDYSTLCLEEPVVKNDSCTNVKWCKISIESMVDSGAIESFPSDVKNEDGSVAYTSDSYVYAAFVDDSLYSELMVIDPGDDYTYKCPPEKEPQVEDDGDSVITPTPVYDPLEDLKSSYNIRDSLYAFYDGKYNQKRVADHSNITHTWSDLIGNQDLSAETSANGPEWGDNYLMFPSGSSNYMSGKFSFPSDITGFTIYAVFSTDGVDDLIDNYSWGFTDDSSNKFIAVGKFTDFLSTNYNNYYAKNPIAIVSQSGNKDMTLGKKIFMAVVVNTNGRKTDISFYQNGSLIDTKTSNSAFSGFTQGNSSNKQGISKLHLGGIVGLKAKTYNTYIYNCLVYKAALSSEEIQQLYTFDSQRFGS